MVVVLTILLAISATAIGYLSCRYRHAVKANRTLITERVLTNVRNEQRVRLSQELSHELKNPLTAIVCSAESLCIMLRDQLDPDHMRSLEYIRDYSDGVLRTISNYLDLSMLEADRINPKIQPFDLMPLIEATCGLLQTNAMKKSITLSISDGDDRLWLEADPKHTKQIIFNIVHNAIKFTPSNGIVHISMFRSEEGGVIEIIDTGPGIAAEQLQRIFDPHPELRSIPSEPSQSGLGLGLPLCRKLVELSGGTIRIESELMRGTIVTVVLPEAPAVEDEDRETPDMRDMRPLEGQRFLLIDPDTGTRESIAGLLRALGGSVDQIGEATAALDAVSNVRYTAIMIDESLSMSSDVQSFMTGLPAGETKVVIASSKNEADAPRNDNAEVVSKPLDSKVILASLLQAH